MTVLFEQWALAIAQFHWLRPWWLLALVPVVLLAFALLRQRRAARQWQALIAANLLPFLLDGKTIRHSPWQIWLLALAWIIATLALAGPAWEKRTLPVQKNENALVIILDLSPSMMTEDLKPSRLVRARLKIADILRERRDGVTALVVYAGDAHVVAPLTDDSATINSLLSALHPNIMPVAGSNTEAAVERAMDLLRDAGANTGDLLLLTDGVVADAQAAIRRQLQNSQMRLSVIGVGGESPAPIPGSQGSFVRDQHNNIVTTQLNIAELRTLAEQNGGRYSTLRNDNRDIAWLTAQRTEMSDVSLQLEREFDGWFDRGHWLVFLLLPIVLYCFRRGVLVVLLWLPASLLYAPESHAFEWRDLWLTRDQQGQRAFEEGKPDTAAENFRDPLWKASAHYRAGDYDAAAKLYAESDSAQAHYNRGNALSKGGKLEEGIKAYEEALQRQPDFPEAADNLELVRKLLEQQQQDQQNQDGEQDQDQQDQEQGDDQQDAQDGDGDPNNQSDRPGEQDESEADNQDQQQSDDQQDGNESQDDEERNGDGNDEAEAEQPDAADSEEDIDAQNQMLAEGELTDEQQQALEQWLRRVPDDPSGLLRNKFRYQHNQQRQERFRRQLPATENNPQERW